MLTLYAYLFSLRILILSGGKARVVGESSKSESQILFMLDFKGAKEICFLNKIFAKCTSFI